jgi:hypothetical protein
VGFWSAATVAVGTSVCAALGGLGGGLAEAEPPTTSVVFDQPGAYQWTVPPGVQSATFELYGAAGGAAGGEAGRGAHVTATLAVSRGTVLTIVVGGRGGNPSGSTAGTGGFGGGAPGGAGAEPLFISFGHSLPGGPGGGGGGGASDVRTGDGDASGLASRLLVAGGGGGAGVASGGAAGAVGQPGTDGQLVSFEFLPPQLVPGGGGGGGTAIAGGAGGDGAGDGSLGAGGAGEQAPPSTFTVIDAVVTIVAGGEGGGGGGAGLYGGGGGASSALVAFGPFQVLLRGASAGGGGGSSLVSGDVLCTPTVETGVSAGDGSVVITYRRGASPRQLCPPGG